MKTNRARVFNVAAERSLPMARAMAVISLLLLGASCRTYYVTSPGLAPEAGGDVRISFRPPQRLTAIGARGDTIVMDRLMDLEGRVYETRAETLEVRVTRWNGGAFTRELDAPTLRVVPGPGVLIEEKRINAGRTAGATLMTALILGAVVGVLFIASIAGTDY